MTRRLTKDWFKSKTVWIALIQLVIAVLGLILTELQQPEITILGLVAVAKSIVDLAVRYKTNTPLKVG